MAISLVNFRRECVMIENKYVTLLWNTSLKSPGGDGYDIDNHLLGMDASKI